MQGSQTGSGGSFKKRVEANQRQTGVIEEARIGSVFSQKGFRPHASMQSALCGTGTEPLWKAFSYKSDRCRLQEADNREAGENPARSRHCESEQGSNKSLGDCLGRRCLSAATCSRKKCVCVSQETIRVHRIQRGSGCRDTERYASARRPAGHDRTGGRLRITWV